MTLDEYLSRPDAPTMAELRRRMRAFGVDVKSDAQIRQWRHRYADRLPSPRSCVALEKASAGAITRRDLRPDDYWLIWPDLPAPRAAQGTARGTGG
ncbi:hypothetical protein GCM10023144_29600 [Pigmentiphaga soli]|uniref:Uncharacterized protein n=1 Tax=Pigmentiphaga soli TaxID=1007095 RepID=A0ABP8H8J7_9BURK